MKKPKIERLELPEGEPLEGEVCDAPAQGVDVDWGPRPSRSARGFKANGAVIRGRVRGCSARSKTLNVSLSEHEAAFLVKLTAWLAARKVLNGVDPKTGCRRVGGGGGYELPGLGHAVGYMISAYGAMLDHEMRDAGVDPETGYELKALPPGNTRALPEKT